MAANKVLTNELLLFFNFLCSSNIFCFSRYLLWERHSCFLSFSSFSYNFMTFCCSLRPGLLPLSYTSCHFSLFYIYGFHLLPFHFFLHHHLFRHIHVILVILFLSPILLSFVLVHLLIFLSIFTTIFWLL